MLCTRRLSANFTQIAKCSSETPKQPLLKKVVVPDKNVMEPLISDHLLKEKGRMYDGKPFEFKCIQGKKYYWCSCGWSRTQPFCDGTHKNPQYKIKLRPVMFVLDETKDVWLCNCKQTNQRPFCDGTCKTEEVVSKFTKS